MGLLDDAIREHLDLKRRRGADPTEVERAEAEALGPVRRDPFEQAQDELEPSAGPATAYDHEEEADGDGGYEPGEERQAAEGDWGDGFDEEHTLDETETEHPAAEAPPAEHVGEPTRLLEPDELDEEDAAAFEDPAVPAPHPAGAGAETVEYDVEEALEAEPPRPVEDQHPDPHPAEDQHPDPHAAEHAAEPAEHAAEPREGSDEDVLEETPEFLQDTPDHDRLWFEQRPPRDFDFEG